MQFDASTPRIALKVNGLAITAPAPFTAGHALTEREAAFLNRQVATAVANPIPSTIKAQIDKALAANPGSTADQFTPNAEKVQAFYDTRYAEFEPGATNRGTGESTATDPVSKFANSIASEKVKELLKAKGKNIRDVMSAKDTEGKSVFHKLVAQYLAANTWVTDLAKSQVEAMSAAAGDTFDLGDLGDSPSPTEVEAEVTETEAETITE